MSDTRVVRLDLGRVFMRKNGNFLDESFRDGALSSTEQLQNIGKIVGITCKLITEVLPSFPMVFRKNNLNDYIRIRVPGTTDSQNVEL